MIYLLLDILIYNYTNYKTYFFLLNLNSNKYFNILTIGIILDCFIFNTYFINTLLLTGFYLLKKYFFNNYSKRLIIYLIYYIVCILIYYLITNLIFNYINVLILLKILLINVIGVIISYIKANNSIDLIGEY